MLKFIKISIFKLDLNEIEHSAKKLSQVETTTKHDVFELSNNVPSTSTQPESTTINRIREQESGAATQPQSQKNDQTEQPTKLDKDERIENQLETPVENYSNMVHASSSILLAFSVLVFLIHL